MALVIHKNLPVIVTRLLHHYNAPEFRNGGIGRDRGAGLLPLVHAACALLVSFFFAVFVASLPVPVIVPPGAYGPARYGYQRRGGTGTVPSADGGNSQPAYPGRWLWGQPQQQPVNMWLFDDSGY
jgi:hypothetical protein